MMVICQRGVEKSVIYIILLFLVITSELSGINFELSGITSELSGITSGSTKG